jgi:hypothetical protein
VLGAVLPRAWHSGIDPSVSVSRSSARSVWFCGYACEIRWISVVGRNVWGFEVRIWLSLFVEAQIRGCLVGFIGRSDEILHVVGSIVVGQDL